MYYASPELCQRIMLAKHSLQQLLHDIGTPTAPYGLPDKLLNTFFEARGIVFSGCENLYSHQAYEALAYLQGVINFVQDMGIG